MQSWWECELTQPLWRTTWRLKKQQQLDIKLPYNPAHPLWGIDPEKIRIEKDTCTQVFIAGLFTIARTWKQPRCSSTEEWIKKL